MSSREYILTNPKLWTREMSDAWHKALPDTTAAFKAIRELLPKNEDEVELNTICPVMGMGYFAGFIPATKVPIPTFNDIPKCYGKKCGLWKRNYNGCGLIR